MKRLKLALQEKVVNIKLDEQKEKTTIHEIKSALSEEKLIEKIIEKKVEIPV